MSKVQITDLTLRDAHQSLIATRMSIEDMLPISNKLDEVGFYSMEVWGGATFDSCIRYLNEDPWERLRKLRKALPNTKLQMLLRGQNILGYKHYSDDVVEAFVKEAAKNGIDIFRIFDALNDIRNLKTAIKAVKKTGKHAQGAISYTVSPVHTIDLYIKLAQDLEEMGCDSICIKDMAGLLLPYDAYKLVKGLKENTSLPISVHSHATTGVSLTSLLKAIEAGADRVDTAISAFSLQTSHSATESIVATLKDTKYDTGLNLELLDDIAKYFKDIRKSYEEFETNTVINTSILSSQVPGGMLSNLESQLKQQNTYEKLDDVLNEIIHVRKDFGYPPLVTPTSQIVGTQATINVMSGERYKTLTTESKNLLIGRYGKTPGEINKDLLQRALNELNVAQPIDHRPADDLEPEMDKYTSKTKEILNQKKVNTEDVLTYALFPNVAPKFFEERNIPKTKKEIKKVKSNGDLSTYLVKIGGKEYTVDVKSASELEIKELQANINTNNTSSPSQGGTPLKTPVTGTVVKFIKPSNSHVEENEVVLLIEAMKVEFEIKAPASGTISYSISEGDTVEAESQIGTIN